MTSNKRKILESTLSVIFFIFLSITIFFMVNNTIDGYETFFGQHPGSGDSFFEDWLNNTSKDQAFGLIYVSWLGFGIYPGILYFILFISWYYHRKFGRMYLDDK